MYYRQKYCKIQNRRRCFLTKTHFHKYEPTQSEPRKDLEISASLGVNETIVWKICSNKVPAMVEKKLQTKITSPTTQRSRPFQEKWETAPQRLEPCVPILLIWDTRLKPRWKIGSVSSLYSGYRPLMFLTKPFSS